MFGSGFPSSSPIDHVERAALYRKCVMGPKSHASLPVGDPPRLAFSPGEDRRDSTEKVYRMPIERRSSRTDGAVDSLVALSVVGEALSKVVQLLIWKHDRISDVSGEVVIPRAELDHERRFEGSVGCLSDSYRAVILE